MRRNRMAIRIQQAWRRYEEAKKAALMENTSLSGIDSLEDSSVVTGIPKASNIGGAGISVNLNPIRAIGSVVEGIKDLFKEKEVSRVQWFDVLWC